MPIRVVQLGTPRKRGEGLRIGTVRRPPRGVLKKDYAKLDYFDVWLPELAPAEATMKDFRSDHPPKSDGNNSLADIGPR